MESLSYIEEELDFGFFHVESEVEDAISTQWELVNASNADLDHSDFDAHDSPIFDGSICALSLQNGIARIDDLDGEVRAKMATLAFPIRLTFLRP
ncbi:hypothetical protein NL676_019252 [Syzygium grande]|nr:hypothetical protein NL676_019252 [Syzygium grande]